MLQISSQSSSQNRSSSAQPTTSRRAANSIQTRVASSHQAPRSKSPHLSNSSESLIDKLLDDARHGVKKHLKSAGHEKVVEWFTLYDARSNKAKALKGKKPLSFKLMCLVKFFIESNIALDALKNKHLRNALDLKIGKYKFENTILPEINEYVINKVEEKMQSASFINLITDIWSNKSMENFIALCAQLINSNFEKLLIVVAIHKMDCSHSAENIKIIIEQLVNKYKFDKKKINSIVTDEGSNLLKLFKQLDSEFCLFDEPLDDEDDEDYLDEDESDDDEDSDDDDDEDIEEVNGDEAMCLDGANLIILSESPTNQDLVDLSKETRFLNEGRAPVQEENLDYDYSTEYELKKGEIIEFLELKIRSNMVPRFSCCAHKMNIAVRKSIRATPYVSDLLTKLSTFIKNVRKNIDQSSRHRKKRCKAQRQNFTRWNSSFNMLFSMHKAYERKVFDSNYECPVSNEEIKCYLKILSPVYLFTNDMQSNEANISFVVPSVLALIYANLDRMILPVADQSLFRDNLIRFIKHKFSYELTSKVYIVSALLNVETLKQWANRSFGIEYYNIGLSSIVDVLRIYNKVQLDEEMGIDPIEQSETTDPFDDNVISSQDGLLLLSSLCRGRKTSSKQDDDKDLVQSFAKEKALFITKLNNLKSGTVEFWRENKKELPYLYDLALRLLSIPASSASVERLFSVAGQINNIRAQNMSSDLLIKRTFLKANMKLWDNYA